MLIVFSWRSVIMQYVIVLRMLLECVAVHKSRPGSSLHVPSPDFDVYTRRLVTKKAPEVATPESDMPSLTQPTRDCNHKAAT